MPSTPLAATTRYIRQGVGAFCYLTTIANTSAPTRAEINAGTALQGQVFDIAGFSQAVETIPTPDYGSKIITQVTGPITYDASTITMYLSLTSNDVRTLLTLNTVGFLLIFLEGDVAGRKMDVWPVTVSRASKQQSRTDPAMIDIGFVITGTPVENVVVPA